MWRVRQLSGDHVGLGWRPALAAGILRHLDRIDVLEVVAEHWWRGGRRERDALRALCAARPVAVHAVSLGLVSCQPVDSARLERLARLLEAVPAVCWSEHLAFVRAGGVEIGHLTAPPRHPQTVAGALANLARARAVVGSLPLLENVATLVEPPASPLDEGAWTRAIIDGSGCGLLLDLHNLLANALNAGRDPLALLESFPLARVRMVHLSGGCWIAAPGGGQRLLDDHLHDVPDAAYTLLEALAARVHTPLEVIIERDGRFPPLARLLAQVDRARAALAAGRARAQPAAA